VACFFFPRDLKLLVELNARNKIHITLVKYCKPIFVGDEPSSAERMHFAGLECSRTVKSIHRRHTIEKTILGRKDF